MSFDWIHLHLMANHLPVVLAGVGAIAGIVALVLRREGIWTYAAVTLVIAAVLAPVALFSGRQAEDLAKQAWFASRPAIHEHEEAGEKATWLSIAAGALALVALRRKGRGWRLSMLVVALAASVALGYTALEGGKIVHDNPKLETAPATGVGP